MPRLKRLKSLWCGMVELFDIGSSPHSSSAAQFFPVPPRLAWRRMSPERSTPGPLPYQMPSTPSTLFFPITS